MARETVQAAYSRVIVPGRTRAEGCRVIARRNSGELWANVRRTIVTAG